jgi:hypothetical protein
LSVACTTRSFHSRDAQPAQLAAGLRDHHLLGVDEDAARRLLAKTPVLSHAALRRADRLPWRVIVEGVTTAGPDGPLIAPLSRQECVWYWVQILHEYYNPRSESNRTGVSWQRAADDEIRLDDSTGVILVSSDLLWRNLPSSDRSPVESPWSDSVTSGESSGVLALRKLGLECEASYQLQGGNTASMWVEERLIRPGRWIVALGRPQRREGEIVLGPPPLGRSGVTLQTLDEIREASAKNASDTSTVVRGIGIVGLILFGGGLALQMLILVLAGSFS